MLRSLSIMSAWFSSCFRVLSEVNTRYPSFVIRFFSWVKTNRPQTHHHRRKKIHYLADKDLKLALRSKSLVKDPVPNVRVWWIMEALTNMHCRLGSPTVAAGFPWGKRPAFFMGEIAMEQQSCNFLFCLTLILKRIEPEARCCKNDQINQKQTNVIR